MVERASIKRGSSEKGFGKTEVLHDISLTVSRGEVYGLVGQNGAGKTTLLRLITGLMKPTGGSVSIHTEKDFVGYMPQSCRFDDSASVTDTIRFFALIRKADYEKGFSLCKKLELDTAKKVIHDYCVGTAQRICRAENTYTVRRFEFI